MVLLALGTALALTFAPWVGWLAYPLRVLETTVHELSHGLVALATGGAFRRYTVYPDGSGVALTAGGIRLLVVPAGYLGVTLFAAGLLGLARSAARARRALLALGVAIVVLTLRYAAPSVLGDEPLAGLLTLVAGVGLGVALFWLGREASAPGAMFAVHLIGFHAALTALTDLWTLVGLSSQAPSTATDARSMAEIAWLPPIVWALAWGALSLWLIGWVLVRTWGGAAQPTRRPKRG